LYFDSVALLVKKEKQKASADIKEPHKKKKKEKKSEVIASFVSSVL
jgi:hypothetical protein